VQLNDSIASSVIMPTDTESILADTTAEILPEQPVEIKEQQKESNKIQTNTLLLANTKYYIVAGVFREEDNADKLVRELKLKGYNAEKFGKIGKMHAVSYAVFASKEEADNYLQKIKGSADAGAWIKIVD
jgi:cell division septation protein DedD